MTKLERIMWWAVTKNRILCSRPFLALHVLRGKPVAYRMHVAQISGPRGARVVECLIHPPGDAKAAVR